MYEVIIIGSGPAGLTAAIYNARADLKPLVIAGLESKGQLMYTTDLENFPGFPDGVDGPTFMINMEKQAKRFGTELIFRNATKIDLKSNPKKVWIGEDTYEAETIIIATGAKSRMLGIPGEKEFFGRGVSTCATCDGAFYRGKTVALVGGGDSAIEEAIFLTRFASKVYMIVRRDEFRASKIMAKKAQENNKIEILWNTEVKEILGDTLVRGAKMWNNKENAESELKFDGIFMAIGHIPVTDIFTEQLELDDGYIVKNKDLKNPNPDLLRFTSATQIPGVFVGGDVEDQNYRQAITAASEGCRAAMDAERYLDSLKD